MPTLLSTLHVSGDSAGAGELGKEIVLGIWRDDESAFTKDLKGFSCSPVVSLPESRDSEFNTSLFTLVGGTG